MHEDEKWFIERLHMQDLSTDDLMYCIDTLEMLLSVDGLGALVSVIANQGSSLLVRKRAAMAIRKIGSIYVKRDLDKLMHDASPEMQEILSVIR